MDIIELSPVVIYDDQCYLCTKFASIVRSLSRGRINLVGHYTPLGEEIRKKCLSNDALEMFWFIDAKVAYGGRAALYPLIKKILSLSTSRERNYTTEKREELCNISCKSPKAVLLRSASLLTHSKKILLNNSSK